MFRQKAELLRYVDVVVDVVDDDVVVKKVAFKMFLQIELWH